MLKKVLLLGLNLILGMSLFWGTSSTASAEINVQPEVDIASFSGYLQQESETDPEAKDILEKFKSLTYEQKKQFVEYMVDPEVFKALFEKASEPVNEPIDESISTVTELYGGDITIARDIQVKETEAPPTEAQKLESSPSLASTTYYRETTISYTQYLFGIPLTTLTSWVKYSHNGSRMLSAYGNGAGARNYNIAVSISQNVSRPWTTSTKAYSETVFQGYAAYKGSGIRMDKKQQVWGNIYNQGGGYTINI